MKVYVLNLSDNNGLDYGKFNIVASDFEEACKKSKDFIKKEIKELKKANREGWVDEEDKISNDFKLIIIDIEYKLTIEY